MESLFFDRNAPKKSTNLSINSDLLRKARMCGVNLSQTLERCLVELLREETHRQWREENRDAIDTYNSRVETDGVFSDGLRRF